MSWALPRRTIFETCSTVEGEDDGLRDGLVDGGVILEDEHVLRPMQHRIGPDDLLQGLDDAALFSPDRHLCYTSGRL